MRRLLSALLALTVALSLVYIPAPAADAAALTEPSVEIKTGRLYYNGKTIDMITCMQTFKVLYLAKADRGRITKQMLDAEPEWPPIALELYINPDNVQEAYKPSAKPQELAEGDALYFALKPAKNGGEYSLFREIVLTEEMFALTSTPSADLLPTLAISGTKLTITPKSRLTKYEYAIIPNSPPQGYYPDWIQVGSASAYGGSGIPVSLRPCSYPHTVRVRVVDDTGPYYASIAGAPQASPVLSVDLELIGPLAGGSSGCYWYLSSNGGTKFQKLYVAAGQDGYFDLRKVFGKNQVDLVLRKSQEDADPAEIKSNILRASVNARAEFSKEYKPNPFVSRQYPENWTLYGLSGSARLEYRVQGTAAWIPFPNQTGLPLLLESEQNMKKKPQKLEFRVAANAAARIPASASKKITQPKQVKAPKLKLDYKKETIKLKDGIFYAFAGSSDEEFENLSFSQSAGLVDIASAITNGQTIYAYTPETDKKSRSAIAKVIPAARGETPDGDEGVVLLKGKAKLVSGFEVYGSKEKWGSLAKGDAAVLVRRKPTAKFNAKTGMTTGEAASLPIKAQLAYSTDGKTVTGITADFKDRLIPTEIYMRVGSNCSIYGRRSSANVNVLAENVYAYEVNMEEARSSYGDLSTCSFNVTLMEPRYIDGVCPAKGITVERNGALLNEGVWGGNFTEAKLGDVFTFRLLPRDRNTHRETVYTVTVAPPVLDAPSQVNWRAAPEAGTAAITLTKRPSPGDAVKLRVRLIKSLSGEDKVLSDSTKAYTGADFAAGTNTIFLNFSKEIAASGIGRYYIRAQCMGNSGYSKDSDVAGSGELAVDQEYLTLGYVELSSDRALQKGAAARVAKATDALGNQLVCSVQWLTSDTKPTSGNTGVEMVSATSQTLTVPEGIEGKYLGARVTRDGKSVTKWFDEPVKHSVSVGAPASPVTVTGQGSLVFSVSGLADPLSLSAPAPDNISVSVRTAAGQTVLEAGTPVINGGTVTVPVTAEADGETDLTLVVTVGSGLTSYVSAGEILGGPVRVRTALP